MLVSPWTRNPLNLISFPPLDLMIDLMIDQLGRDVAVKMDKLIRAKIGHI